jgi:hypothetical protein
MVYNGHIFSVATFDLTTIRTKFNPNQRCSIKMHVLLYKTDRYGITEILLKVALHIIKQANKQTHNIAKQYTRKKLKMQTLFL